MECISEEMVEQTWQTIAQLEPDSAAQQMMSFATAQPHLLGFVTTLLEDLEDESRELGTYLMFVVYKMFENSATAAIPMMEPAEIKKQYEANQEFLLGIDTEDEQVMEEMAYLESSKQPWVFRYVTEALLEEDEDDVPEEEQLSLTEEDFGEIFLVLKTVIDVLDTATN